ncbi:hypothetical protein GN958_ATG05084 [Phytophthora infestans]|uniref:Uncharacterized protein n=1 Tax=Phytophthora infestans TaxID=4787 RepID=A0A8S9V138_PHYIN|nr:hypothetical protein GN958_ATG05084 [Phytophthora infestans]
MLLACECGNTPGEQRDDKVCSMLFGVDHEQNATQALLGYGNQPPSSSFCRFNAEGGEENRHLLDARNAT